MYFHHYYTNMTTTAITYNPSNNTVFIYRVAQNKIPHQTIRNISTTSGLILKILEAA